MSFTTAEVSRSELSNIEDIGNKGSSQPGERTSVGKQIGADLSLLLVTLIWGTTFVIVKDILQSLPPYTFIALRFTLAVVTLILIFGKRLRSLDGGGIRAGSLVGLFLFAGFVLQTFGLQITPASTSAFITGLSVVMVPLVGLLWLKDRPSRGAVLGVTVATFGLGLLTLGDDLSVGSGDLLVFFCAVAFALHIVAVGKFAPKMDALALTIVQLGFVCLLSWVVALSTESALWSAIVWTPELIGVMLFIGIVATALVFCIQNVAQRFTSATHTALIFTMEPVFAAFFAYLWLGESLSGRSGIGAALILVGMLAAELWPKSNAPIKSS